MKTAEVKSKDILFQGNWEMIPALATVWKPQCDLEESPKNSFGPVTTSNEQSMEQHN